MKTRIKMHQMPGDVPKSEKIAMLEGTSRNDPIGNPKRSKAYRKELLMRERAIIKERTKKELEAAQDEGE